MRGGGDRVADRGDTRPVPDPTALTTQQVNREILSLRELMEEKLNVHNERFEAIKMMFTAHDKALAAALSAAKEAVSKSEAGTMKQLEGTDEKIGDMKERLTRMESRAEGGAVARTSGMAIGHFVMALIGVFLGLILGAITIFGFLSK